MNKHFERKYVRWSVGDVEMLRRAVVADQSVIEIAAQLERTVESIRARMRKDGLRSPSSLPMRGPNKRRSIDWFLS